MMSLKKLTSYYTAKTSEVNTKIVQISAESEKKCFVNKPVKDTSFIKFSLNRQTHT